VLTNRSAPTAGRDYGLLSGRTWRLADLGAKQSMLLAGLGGGNMPAHLVETDIAQGRLKVIRPVEFDARIAQWECVEHTSPTIAWVRRDNG
jgi:DNA-binding transcriptional LysR family regulator